MGDLHMYIYYGNDYDMDESILRVHRRSFSTIPATGRAIPNTHGIGDSDFIAFPVYSYFNTTIFRACTKSPLSKRYR